MPLAGQERHCQRICPHAKVLPMSSDEKKELQSIIITLADPVGNWPFAWKRLCEMAELDPNQRPPHFKPHPILDEKVE